MRNTKKFCLALKIASVFCILAIFSCLTVITAFAAEDNLTPHAVVVSSRTTEENIYIYIKGIADISDGSTVQVGNSLCEDIQPSDIASLNIPIKTTILFDNSQSLSKKWGSQAKELVKELIDSHQAGEEFRIATFADSLTMVSDYSADYDTLKAKVEEIEYLDQDSYLTDILYELLEQTGNNGEANYTRFIIITDGADDQEIKYTQSEMQELLKESGVVIHAVGIKNSKNDALLENLFSYARLTGGTYSIVEKDTEVNVLRNTIDEDYALLCLKLVPGTDIMDGSRREARLSLNTAGGEVILRTSLQMPFAKVSNEPVTDMEVDAVPAFALDEKEDLPSIATTQQEGKVSKKEAINFVPVLIAAGVLVLVVVVVLVLLAVQRSRKKRQVDVMLTGNGQPDGSSAKSSKGTSGRQNADVHAERMTVRLGEGMDKNPSGKTLRLQGFPGQGAVKQAFFSITDIQNPQRTFRVPIDTRVVIGRESGDIRLGEDASVSHVHCEIIKKGNLFYINDLKSSNGTFYGNERVCHETPVISGGILEIGTVKYKITIEN